MNSSLFLEQRDLPRYLWERHGTRSLIRKQRYRPSFSMQTKIRSWVDGSPRQPAITVCVPTKDRLDLLVPCLASLAETCVGEPVDVVVGDTGSEDESLATYDMLGVHVVHVPGPFSFSRTCNRMAAVARGERLLFLNSDTEAVSRDWVKRALAGSQEAVVGAALVYPGTRRLQHAGVQAVETTAWLAPNAYRPPRGERADCALAMQNIGIGRRLESVGCDSATVMAVTGAFLLTRRAHFDTLNGFDEAFSVDLQDTDYCFRARNIGIDVVCRRDIVFSHKHAASRGRYGFPSGDWGLFTSRWKPELERWSSVATFK